MLAGVVLGGLNRPVAATLGGFAIGFASGLLGGALPTAQSQYLPTFLFAAVILVLLVRPNGLFTRGRGLGGARMRRVRSRAPGARSGPRRSSSRRRCSGSSSRRRRETYFIDTLVKVSIVVALYVFIGNSGVLSFGHISFVALGAWTAGVLSVPGEPEAGDHAEPRALPPRRRPSGTCPRCCSPRRPGSSSRLIVGLPLMRLSGLAAGIATFGVLEITSNLLRYYEKIGPGLNAFSSVPETTGIWQAAIGALICVAVAFAYQRSRFGRMLRATREDPAAAAAAGHLDLPAAARSRSRSPAASPASRAGSTSTCCRSTSTRSIST